MGKYLDYLLNEAGCVLAKPTISMPEGMEEYKDVRTAEGDYVTSDFLADTEGELAEMIYNHKLTKLQALDEGSGKAIQIGFSEPEQKWYGWTHRGHGAFGVGDKIPKDAMCRQSKRFPIDKDKKLETLEDCKYFAMAMADVLD
ncbi:MAG: hypothetical protein NC218_01640 [Acetobacter sp.]|nr:hypothetical protein [Acetobacter sp.]